MRVRYHRIQHHRPDVNVRAGRPTEESTQHFNLSDYRLEHDGLIVPLNIDTLDINIQLEKFPLTLQLSVCGC